MTQRLFIRSARRPEEDPSSTGLGFVDILFGVVVAKALDLSLSADLTTAGKAHLILAALVTVTSWVGYHNSRNRSRFLLRPFTNIPFWHFAIDVALVGAYWLLVVSFDGRNSAQGAEVVPDARPESYILAGIFALYLAWDALALWMQRSPRYSTVPMPAVVPARRVATVAGVAIMAVVALSAWLVHPTSTGAVVAWDAGLGALVLAYRVLKEWLTPPVEDEALAAPASSGRTAR